MFIDPCAKDLKLRDSEVSRNTKQLNNLGWNSQQLQDFSHNMQQLQKIWLQRATMSSSSKKMQLDVGGEPTLKFAYVTWILERFTNWHIEIIVNSVVAYIDLYMWQKIACWLECYFWECSHLTSLLTWKSINI